MKNNVASITQQDNQIICSGIWTVNGITNLRECLMATLAKLPKSITINIANVPEFDTAGAWLLHEYIHALKKQQIDYHIDGLSEQHQHLLSFIAGQA